MQDFESLGVKAGTWSGLLRRETAPGRVLLMHMGVAVSEASVSPEGAENGVWRIEVALPAAMISEGVQSFVLLADDRTEGDPDPGAERLGHINIVAGAPLEMDLRAEIDLLRAELDLLKREFRRQARADQG